MLRTLQAVDYFLREFEPHLWELLTNEVNLLMQDGRVFSVQTIRLVEDWFTIQPIIFVEINARLWVFYFALPCLLIWFNLIGCVLVSSFEKSSGQTFMGHLQHKSDSDVNRRYMCYCITLYTDHYNAAILNL